MGSFAEAEEIPCDRNVGIQLQDMGLEFHIGSNEILMWVL